MDSYHNKAFESEENSIREDYIDFEKTSPNQNQLTVSTIISISGDIENCKNGSEVGGSCVYNDMNEEKCSKNDEIMNNNDSNILITEKWYYLTLQVVVPFLLAGMGTIGAGLVLATVYKYPVFHEVKALYVLVPSLLGLKGNLDMCLASRLSTQANMGNMSSKKEIFKMIVGNLGLVQVQSIVASCLVAIFAVSASAILKGDFQWRHALLLGAASTLTATISCFILDFLLIGVIFLSYRMKLNPDNLATPLAASIGDVVSLVSLSLWANILFDIHDEYPWVIMLILAVYLLVLLPLWIFIVLRNKYTCKVLTDGWTPVLSALIISGMGGLVLDSAVDEFQGFAVFQPIVNGIGGNLVSVQASRTSTMLHKTSLMGVIPPHTKQFVAPWTALFRSKKVLPAKTARILIAICVPGHTIFAFIADFLFRDCESDLGAIFLISYLSVGLIQVIILLYSCHLMTHTMWRYKIDPDNGAIPYLTALGDLSGSCLLLAAFHILKSFKDRKSVV